MSQASLPSITVALPAHNEEKYIAETLRRCTQALPPNVFEIIVIDNASTDDTARVARQFPHVRVVHEPVRGISFARQRAFLEAKTELIAFLDADTHIDEDWYEVINRAFTRDSKLACLSGPCDFYDLPETIRWAQYLCQIFVVFPVSWMLRYMVMGGNFVVRRDTLEKIGGFDTSIDFYSDDGNLGRRLKGVGKVRFTQDLSVRTSGRRYANEGFAMTTFRYAINFLADAFWHQPLTTTHQDFR